MKKRILSLAICLCLMLSILPSEPVVAATELDVEKNTAITSTDNEARIYSDKIEKLMGLSGDEKTSFIAQIQTTMYTGWDSIRAATTTAEVKEAEDLCHSQIHAIFAEAEKLDAAHALKAELESEKENEKTSLASCHANACDNIDYLSYLSAEEKDSYCGRLDLAYSNALTKIEAATDIDTVKVTYRTFSSEADVIVNEARDLNTTYKAEAEAAAELVTAKENAKTSIMTAAAASSSNIKQLSNLSAGESVSFIAQISAAGDTARAAIDAATTTAEVKAAAASLYDQVDAIVAEAKKLDAAHAADYRAGSCGDNVTWTLDSDGVLTISGTGAMANKSEEYVPWYSIRTEIKTVIIEDGVTTIGSDAFNNCTNLASVTIPSRVTSIGSSAFRNCTNLASVTIPSSVTSIGISAFANCTNLASVTIPSSVTSIGPGAFRGCSGVEKFSVNSANTAYSSDSAGALFNKDKTTLLYYPAGNTHTAYAIPSSVTSIDSSAFENCTNLTSVTIPSSVTSIGSSAFKNCTNLASVNIPSSVTSIGYDAFENCTNLTSVNIPSSVTSIGSDAFDGCSGVEKFSVNSANTAYSSDSAGALFNKDKTTLLYYPAGSTRTAYTIPSGVATISCGAFDNCTRLVSITIPSSVTFIGNGMTGTGAGVLIRAGLFWNCTSLTKITVDSANTKYSSDSNGVLYNKDKTTLVSYPAGSTRTAYTIPSGVTSIEYGAFNSCSNLASITIPDSVTSIRVGAFYGCRSLTDVYYDGTRENWNAITIYNSYSSNEALTAANIHCIIENIVVNNGTANSNALVGTPEGGWREGTNTFSVSAAKPCYVAVSYDGGNTYIRLEATANGTEYSFTAENMDANTVIAVVQVGDLNADGEVKAQDARLALQAASGNASLTALQMLAVDLNNDGRISAQEARQLLQAAAGLYELTW